MKRVALVLALLASARVAEAQPTEAESLYVTGQQAYDERRYDAALLAWNRSYELSRLPGLLFNIAQAYRLRGLPGDCAKASESYRQFIQLDPQSTQRATAEGFLRELEVCGVAPTTIGPPGASTSPEPTRRDPSTGSGKRLAAYGIGGAGIAIGLAGVYFGAKASRLGKEVTDDCRDGCDWSVVGKKDDEGRSAARTQWILYGVGAAAIVTGGVLYVLGSREQRAAVAVTPQASGATVTWSGTW
ncbi:MAG TPA: hypothetical protein VIU61_24590 [Kofleriaceae bacterium]